MGDQPDTLAMLARIDERTALMKDAMDKLATKEMVQGVDRDLRSHIDDHAKHETSRQWKIGTVIASVLAMLGLGISAIKK